MIAISTLFNSCRNEQKTADLIITGARIWTGNPEQPRASAMAVNGDTIVKVGDDREILRLKGTSTRLVDMNGLFVVPGFIDSHVHFLEGGFNLTSVQLRDASTKEEFISRISDYARTLSPGTWILGGDWDHTLWGGELPEKSWIDSVTQHNPVFVSRLDGHMSLANSFALRLAGIGNQVKNVEGGSVVRDKGGRPTGIFKDNATWLIQRIIPAPSEEQSDKALSAAMAYVASNGVTSVHHMCGNLDAIERARDNHTLITRIYAMMPIQNLNELKEKTGREGRGDDWLKTGGLKAFLDGSLGSHTAAFFSPYEDSPADSGLFVEKTEDLYKLILDADREGFQVMIHAIGDRAIHTLLNMYDSVAAVNGPGDRRFRIEHAQHISEDDFTRFAKTGIIASMQPYHAIDDGRWAEKLIGPGRIRTSYAFRSLFDSGALVAFGSDWYVAPPSPIDGIYAAVTRRTLDGKNPEGWVPEEKITVEQALTAYTRNAAYASFDENRKGILEPGKLADFTVISKDLTAIDPAGIREAKIMQTWVGGKKVFEIQ